MEPTNCYKCKINRLETMVPTNRGPMFMCIKCANIRCKYDDDCTRADCFYRHTNWYNRPGLHVNYTTLIKIEFVQSKY